MDLTPTLAATLADSVYGVQDQSNVARGAAARMGGSLSSTLLDNFDISGSAVAGVSGAGFLQKKTGFGYVATGKGRYAGDIAVVCRGTSAAQDWLSNANCAMDRTLGGLPVHAGFNRVYNSMAPTVNEALRGKNPANIHVVGHSLGGAIANIFAANLAGRASVSLYTFGAPRPALGAFSDYLKSELGPSKINRVYATADVVPMVPLWPFIHTSSDMGDMRVTRGGQGLSLSAHFMTNYTPAVDGANWRSLRAAGREAPNFKSIDYWLDMASNSAVPPMSGASFWMLGKALQGILALARGILGVAVMTTFTAIDQVAMLLSRAAAVSGEIGMYLAKLMTGIFKFLGRSYTSTQEMTSAFLRYVLNMLFSSVATIARQAVSRIV